MRRVRRCGEGLIWRALAALATVAAPWTSAPWSPAHAGDSSQARDDAERPRFEVWSGAQAYDRVWSLYSGSTVAPFGSVHEDGVRLRLVAGYSADSYAHLVKLPVMGAFAEALVGYHMQRGPLTLKVFARVMAADKAAGASGDSTADFGGKVALETWWNVGDTAWTSVDLSWGSLDQSHAGRARLGWRLSPALSAGLESGAAGSVEYEVVRAGAFVRYEWASGEISVSGGATHDDVRDGIGGLRSAAWTTHFATVSWLTRF